MQDAHKLLLDILEIIEFQDDKEQFSKEFFQLAQQQAILNKISELPQPQQDELKAKLAEAKSDQIVENLLKFIPKDELEKAVTTSVETIFKEYLEAIVPTLTEPQKEKLGELFSSLKTATA